MDKVTEALLAGLKEALARGGEQRLYRSGKLDGLFASKSGAGGEAAARALRDGFLELVRSETKGKTAVDWVKPTPKGVNFVHDNESPVQVLRELRELLQVSRDSVPAWLERVRQEMQAQHDRLMQEVDAYLARLDAVGKRVDEALQRAAILGPAVPDAVASSVPWATDALGYLDRRHTSGAADDCPLPELFAALRERHAELSLPSFHDGLRRLQDRRLLRLTPARNSASLAEPEYALLDGDALLYFAGRL
jgi:hypothetical protein